MAEPTDTRHDFYVYAYYRDGVPIYVGKGRGSRWRRHASGTSHNLHLKRAIDKDRREETNLISSKKIREALSERQALDLESELIKFHGKIPNGTLFNVTDGGMGTLGLKHTEEERKRIANRMKGNKAGAGRIITPETREKLREATKNRQISDETREKIRMARARQVITDETKRRQSEALKGRAKSEQAVLNMKAAHAGMIPSQKFRDAAYLANKGKKRSEETKKKMSMQRHGKKHTDEAKLKMSNSQKIRCALRKQGITTPAAPVVITTGIGGQA